MKVRKLQINMVHNIYLLQHNNSPKNTLCSHVLSRVPIEYK